MDRFLEQVAIEASQMYVTEDGKSRFANTVRRRNLLIRQLHGWFIALSNFGSFISRPSRSSPTRSSWTYSLISRIWRSVGWVRKIFSFERLISKRKTSSIFSLVELTLSQHRCAVGGGKSHMIQSCGEMFRCDRRCQVGDLHLAFAVE